MSAYLLVQRDDSSADFFDAAGRGQLQMKRGPSGTVLPPHARIDPDSTTPQLHPMVVSGQGTIVSWSVVHQAPHPALSDAVPYISALVELAEGPWLIVRLVGPTAPLHSGARVRARFARTGTEAQWGEVVPVFELVASPAQRSELLSPSNVADAARLEHG